MCATHYKRWWRFERPDDRAVCTIAGCAEPVVARGWCHRHYMRWRRRGDPNIRAPGGVKPVVHPGDVYGRLTVMEEVDPPLYYGAKNGRRFKCRCSCGTVCEVWSVSLRNGRTRSCGCLRRETARRLARPAAR